MTGSKGVGLGVGRGKAHSLEQLDSLNVDWFYSWGTSGPARRATADFVPMIWGRGSVEAGAVEKVVTEMFVTRATELLGFNEPDHPGQADMTPSAAAKLWPRLEESGLRLGSPAPVHADGDWLKRFMAQCEKKDLRVDFIAMHTYASPDTARFLEGVREVHRYYGKPIWITEYAVADWDATPANPSKYSEDDIMTFMAESAAGLRDMPFVERFAWKTRRQGDPVMGASALFRRDGRLTPTGELYSSI